MTSKLSVIVYVLPELLLVLAALVVLIIGVSKNPRSKSIFWVTQIAVLLAFGLTLYMRPSINHAFFYDQLIVDPLSYLLKSAILLVVFFVFLYGRHYIRDRPILIAEFYALALLSVLGMLVLVSTNNLLSLYLAVECLSLPIYAMVALQSKRMVCIEAAMKYFVLGAFASGLFLYGISMIFGAFGVLDLPTIAQYAMNMDQSHGVLTIFGMVFLLAGLCFKLGAAPFHMWVPDVYEGAPSHVTLFISAAPKLAVFALLIRILVMTLPVLSFQWHEVLVVAAFLSIGLGNILAIVQDNIKRLLAYSSIAHMGYVLLAFSIATPQGEEAALFYLIVYALMTVAAFGMIVLMSHKGYDLEKLEDLSGLNAKHSWLAFLMLLIMFSMAGVPPIVGFIAKMRILEALIEANHIVYAVVALLFAVIGAYYYLRVVKIMYFNEPCRTINNHYTRGQALAIGVNSLAVLVLGVYPAPLFQICQWVFAAH